MSVRSLERARPQAAPYIVFEDLRHGWEAVPFQKVQPFPATCGSGAPPKIVVFLRPCDLRWAVPSRRERLPFWGGFPFS